MGFAQITAGIWRLRSDITAFYLLRDELGFGLIDTGWLGGRKALALALASLGADWSELNLIVLTHGHIDHTANAAWVQARAPARLWVHAADVLHVRGRPAYRGWSRVCGWLEAVARPLVGYRAPEIHGTFRDAELLPRFGGLRVVHLPGHTAGHCGLVHVASGLLFCGDLFSTTLGLFHWPPPVLNSAPERLLASRHRAAGLGVRGFLPCHCDDASPEVQRERFLRRMVQTRATGD